MFRRILAKIFLLIFLFLTAWVIYAALRPEVLPLGSKMPAIDFLTEATIKKLKLDTTRTTIVVYFSNDCKHCQYMLKMIDENLNVFQDIFIILLTSEDVFFERKSTNKWPNLKIANNITWGIVKSEEITKHFGVKITPTTLIFSKAGVLFAKIVGEVRLEKILTEVRKNDGSGTSF